MGELTHKILTSCAACSGPPHYAPAPASVDMISMMHACRSVTNCMSMLAWLEQPTKAAWWPWPLTLKVVSESRVTLATSVPILVFLGLSVLDLGPMYATESSDRQTSDAHHRLMPLPVGWGIIKVKEIVVNLYGASMWSVSKVLRYSMHCQGISQFYLHTLCFICKRNEPYLPLPSQPQLVLIYQPQRYEGLGVK